MWSLPNYRLVACTTYSRTPVSEYDFLPSSNYWGEGTNHLEGLDYQGWTTFEPTKSIHLKGLFTYRGIHLQGFNSTTARGHIVPWDAMLDLNQPIQVQIQSVAWQALQTPHCAIYFMPHIIGLITAHICIHVMLMFIVKVLSMVANLAF